MRQLPARLRPGVRRLQQTWWNLLPSLRSRLPEPVNRSLGDRALTAVILGIALLLVGLGLSLLSGPSRPVQAALPAVAPAPVALPETSLTPDPERIAALQEQVTAVTEQYSSGLIQSVQATFQRGRLTVKLGDGWYRLGAPQQDQLAAELWQRSQKLGFGKLELVDLEGHRLARTPVVGEEMIILQRDSELLD